MVNWANCNILAPCKVSLISGETCTNQMKDAYQNVSAYRLNDSKQRINSYTCMLQARDVLCSCHLKIMDLRTCHITWEGDRIKRRGCEGGGDSVSLGACLYKGQTYYADIERAEWPKQGRHQRQTSIRQGQNGWRQSQSWFGPHCRQIEHSI